MWAEIATRMMRERNIALAKLAVAQRKLDEMQRRSTAATKLKYKPT